MLRGVGSSLAPLKDHDDDGRRRRLRRSEIKGTEKGDGTAHALPSGRRAACMNVNDDDNGNDDDDGNANATVVRPPCDKRRPNPNGRSDRTPAPDPPDDGRTLLVRVPALWKMVLGIVLVAVLAIAVLLMWNLFVRVGALERREQARRLATLAMHSAPPSPTSVPLDAWSFESGCDHRNDDADQLYWSNENHCPGGPDVTYVAVPVRDTRRCLYTRPSRQQAATIMRGCDDLPRRPSVVRSSCRRWRPATDPSGIVRFPPSSTPR